MIRTINVKIDDDGQIDRITFHEDGNEYAGLGIAKVEDYTNMVTGWLSGKLSISDVQEQIKEIVNS